MPRNRAQERGLSLQSSNPIDVQLFMINQDLDAMEREQEEFLTEMRALVREQKAISDAKFEKYDKRAGKMVAALTTTTVSFVLLLLGVIINIILRLQGVGP